MKRHGISRYGLLIELRFQVLILLRNQTLGQRAYEGKKNQYHNLSKYVRMLSCRFAFIVWVSEIMLQQVKLGLQ